MVAHTLHEWLADPLFAAAEDVQLSADRLESNFRTWKQETQDESRTEEALESLRLRLVSGCDTLKWQLEGFERAVRTEGPSHGGFILDSSARKRRQEFVDIIRLQLCAIEVQARSDDFLNTNTNSRVEATPRLASLKVDHRKFSEQALTAAFAAEIVLPGENEVQDVRSSASRSPATRLTGFFGDDKTGTSCSDRNQFPRSASRSALSGFLGVSSPRDLVRSPSSLPACGPAPSSFQTEGPRKNALGINTDEMRQNFSASLSETGEGLSARSQPAHIGGPPSPGPECKSFPSLAHMKGAQHGAQGWQCFFTWMHMSRRRMPESEKRSQEDVLLHSSSLKEPGHAVAVSARLEAVQVLSLSRTSSAVNLNDQRGEWHMDMTSTSAPLSPEEQSKKITSAWHLTSRPRCQTPGLVRPVRPVSSLILVCAAAILMIAAAVCSRYVTGDVHDQRHASLLKVPSLQASSPALPGPLGWGTEA